MKWAARLSPAAIASLDSLRLSTELEICECGGELWLRGAGEIPLAVPWTRTYCVSDEGIIREPGHHLPTGKLPGEKWRALADIMRISLPAISRDGFPPPRVQLSLTPCSVPDKAGMIELTPVAWKTFAESAPALRLTPLRFAQTEGGRVFVVGTPLPSLQGIRYVLREGIAAPTGFTWSPQLSPATVRAVVELGENDVLVLQHESVSLRIPARAWQPATRAAIRTHVA